MGACIYLVLPHAAAIGRDVKISHPRPCVIQLGRRTNLRNRQNLREIQPLEFHKAYELWAGREGRCLGLVGYVPRCGHHFRHCVDRVFASAFWTSVQRLFRSHLQETRLDQSHIYETHSVTCVAFEKDSGHHCRLC